MPSIEEEIDLVELELDSDYDTEDIDNVSSVESTTDTTNLSYPCGIISGINSTHEVEYLKNRRCDEDSSLPLYINYEGLVLPMGKIELTMDYLLMLKTLDVGKEYKLRIYKTKDSYTEIELNDAETLIKFIKL